MNKLSVESNIASELKRRILDGEYYENSSMPAQRQLSKEFQTSLSTISKALIQVKEHGLIELIPRCGARVLPVAERPTTGLVGIIIWRAEAPTQYEPKLIIDGVCRELSEHNQHYEFIYMLEPKNQKRNLLNELDRYAGFIFIEMLNATSMLAELEKRRFPYVVANLEEECEFTSTWVNHSKTTTTAFELMLAFKHQKVALLTGKLNSYFYKSAFKGYKNGLKHAGLDFDEQLIITVAEDNTETAYMTMKKYLNEQSMPTAIIACRDYLAAGAWQAIKEQGLNIGTGVSIIGFDNLSWQDNNELTTFNEPAMELGKVAAEMLIERITYGFKPVEKRELEAPLILRSSVGPCQVLSSYSLPLKLYKSA